jgi:hypothetical protein
MVLVGVIGSKRCGKGGRLRRVGFAPGADGAFALGGLRVRLAAGAALELRVAGFVGERPDGLAVVAARERQDAARGDDRPVSTAGDRPGSAASSHPNGALAIDHVVVLADDRDRTAAALAIDHVVVLADDRDRTAAALAATGSPR